MDQVETLPFEPSASMMDAHNEDAIVIDDEPDSQPRYCQEESMPCCDSDLPKSRWCAICLEQSVGDEVPATQAEALTSEDEAAKPTAKENDEQDEKPHGRMPDEVPDLADAKVPLVARRQQLELGKATADDDEEDEEEDEKSKKRRKVLAKAKAKAKSKAKAKAKATAKAKAKAKSKAKAKAKSSSKAPKRKAAEEDPSEEDKKKHKDNKTANEVAENQDEEIKIAENKSQERRLWRQLRKRTRRRRLKQVGRRPTMAKRLARSRFQTAGSLLLLAAHIGKVGVMRDVIGSILFWCVELGYFGQGDVPTKLQSAHGSFRLYCHSTGQHPSLRSFTKALFMYKSRKSFPWSNTKGSDSVLLLKWIRVSLKGFIQDPTQDVHLEVLELMHSTVSAALSYYNGLYSHGLFLSRPCAVDLYLNGRRFIAGFNLLAQKFLGQRNLFAVKPKLHMWVHCLVEIRQALERGSFVASNPLTYNCEGNEDAIGRISRLSRRLDSRGVHLEPCSAL